MQSQLVQPTIETLKKTIDANSSLKESPNVYPVYKYVPYNDITIHQAYLKLANLNDSNRTESFLLNPRLKVTLLIDIHLLGYNLPKSSRQVTILSNLLMNFVMWIP